MASHGWGYADRPLSARFSRFGSCDPAPGPTASVAEGALEQVTHRRRYAVLRERDLVTLRGARHVVGEGVGDGPGRGRGSQLVEAVAGQQRAPVPGVLIGQVVERDGPRPA